MPEHDVIHVHVENAAEMVATPTVEVEPEHFTCNTFTVPLAQGVNTGGAQGNPNVQQILWLDPQRKSCSIASIDSPVILCESYKNAQDVANQGATVSNAQGAILPPGFTASLDGTGPLWIVATVATPSRVSVIQNRRGSA